MPYDLSCVVHVHSTFSDGTATVPEIAAAAEAAGADAVLVTDHDSLGALHAGHEGRHGGVLVLVGVEISSAAGHYLAFGLRRAIDHRGLTPTAICRAVAAAGGVGFAAHPFSRGARLSRKIAPAHGWPALDDGCCAGLELWSLVTDTAEEWPSLRAAARFLRDPDAAIDGPPRRHLEAWDRLCTTRRMAAIGGLDAHQTGLRVGRRVLSPMRHERYFRLLRTHALLDGPLSGDLGDDRATVYRALGRGSAFLHRPTAGPADGARFGAEHPSGDTTPMGAEGPADGPVLDIRLPRAADVRLLRDGRPVAEACGARLRHRAAAAGAYRFEARVGDRLWLVSNPVYLRDGGVDGAAGSSAGAS